MEIFSEAQQEKTLQHILSRHCQDKGHSSGLLLLTLPTGFGKTYYVLEYIAEHIQKQYPQKIWFITNLKKNLPFESLKERVGEELFKQKVLALQSYSEQVQQFFETQDIPEGLKLAFRSYRGLRKAIGAIKNAPRNPEFKAFLQEELARKELGFRRELKTYLAKEFHGAPSYEERLRRLREIPELRWVEEMYPSVLLFEKQVFFCTVDKFFLYVDTIIGPNLQITHPKNIQGSIVFIDEFDAAKQNVKRAIIDNAVRFNQDILGLFTQIFYGIGARKLLASRLKGSPDSQVDYLQKKYDKLVGEAWRIYSDYQFQSHFYHRGNADASRAFLFHDFEYHTIFGQGERGNKPGFLTRRFDREDQTNYIRIEDDRPEKNEDSLLFLLNDLRSFIHLFAYFISDFARAYKAVHDDSNPEEISIENAIRTALDLFDLRDSNIQSYFIGHISQRVFIHQYNTSTQFDFTPVNQGFRYYDILNRKNHDATSKILYADTVTTPETWLLNLCQHAKVVGISATAGFDSPISNFSLSHLSHHLKDRYFELDAETLEVLRAEFDRKNKYAGRRVITPVSISCSSDRQQCLEELFPDQELVLQFLHQFSGLKSFDVQRYVKVGMAYAHFLQHPEIRSFLCLLNKFPKAGRLDNFQEQALKELLAELRRLYLNETLNTAREQVEVELKILDSQGFDEKLEEANGQLQSGGRIFLISTYQTMGAGQNIQYPAPDGVEVVEINGLDYGGRKKDYDAIYLEKPTHLLNYFQPGEEMADEGLLDYLFEVEYLAEGGAISRQEKKDRIRYGFRRRFNPHLMPPSNKPLYQRRAVAEHFCRVLIQAVGRLSRTRLKPPTTYILYDERIRDYLQFFQRQAHLLVPEFDALLSHCLKPLEAPPDRQAEIINRNTHNALAFAALVRQLVRGIPEWRQETINFWEGLRDFVLKYPTISKERLQKSGLQKFYITHPEGRLVQGYSFQSEDDFRNGVIIDFYKGLGKEVSSEGALLPELMKIPLIEELFREKQYAVSFTPNEYILSPPLFQNIYLGALGEVIGQRVLSHFNISCQPLNIGQYELFDARISGTLYVDFKFWGANTLADARQQKEKIREKMERANAQHVLIINIVSHGGHLSPVIGDDGIVEIPGILDLREGKVIQKAIEFIHQYISEHE